MPFYSIIIKGDVSVKVELLSPVGNFDTLYQAIFNGCDAVYLGGKKFGARAFSENFTEEEMKKAIELCHLYGVKIYVTVNTLILDNEEEELLNYVEFLYKNGVDAVIMQDLGMIKRVRELFPNLVIHASTQMHNQSIEEIKLLKDMGVKRVVLARELSLDEIKKIDIDIEKEIFIHGALCVCYSGQCLFSSMNGLRSGNRGECVGSCRLPYQFLRNDEVVPTAGNYLLSTSELNTLKHLKEILKSGVVSLKIEGRMKSSEYVGFVTRLYRKAIDEFYETGDINVDEQDIINLKKLFNREFTKGYLLNDRVENIMNIKTPNHLGVVIGQVLSSDKNYIKIKLDDDLNQEDGIRFGTSKGMIVNRLYNDKLLLVSHCAKGDICYVENKVGQVSNEKVAKTLDKKLMDAIKKLPERKIDVDIFVFAKVGNRLKIVMKTDNEEVDELGSEVQEALNSPVTTSRIEAQLQKLGNTPFKPRNIEIVQDDNIFIPIGELNDIRRKLVEKLVSVRVKPKYEAIIKRKKKHYDDFSIGEFSISVSVTNEEQLKAALKEKVNNIYTDDFLLYEHYKNKCNIYYITPRVCFEYPEFKGERLVASTLGAVQKYSNDNEVVGNYFLNVVNNNTLETLRDLGLRRINLSVEKFFDHMMEVKVDGVETEKLVYGRVQLMITKYCPMNLVFKSQRENCNICEINKFSLKDRNGKIYPIVVNQKHLVTILDNKNINLIGDIPKLMTEKIGSYRLDLFDEDFDETIKIIRKVKDKLYE